MKPAASSGAGTPVRDATPERALDAPGARLLDRWRRLAPLPGGAWLFSRLLGRMVPYTGTLGARVVTLEPGRAVVRLSDRRAIRNHLQSIHAVALANLGELTSGLAMLTALPPRVRGIVIRIEVDYLKKARGTLTALSTVDMPDVSVAMDVHPVADVTDDLGDVVARCRATWRVQPQDDGTMDGPHRLPHLTD